MNYKFEPACRRMEWLDPFYKAVWEKAFAEAIPISGTFELTPRCNFNCCMCYVHLQPERIAYYGREMNASNWIHTAEEAKEAGTTWLCVTGGEPLMHPEFPEIWKYLSKMGFFITLQTNASLISGRIMSLFREYPPRSVKISLYGSNDRIYENVCKVKNGFTRVDEGIHNFIRLGIPIRLVSTIVQQNKDDILNMALYAAKNRLPWTITSDIRKSCRGSENKIEEARIEKSYRQKASMVKRMKEFSMDLKRKPCTYCKDYRIGYWIMWNGEMRFCSFMNVPNISVKQIGFEKAWQELLLYEENLDWPEECKNCIHKKKCFKCIGVLTAECGSPYKITKTFCESARLK